MRGEFERERRGMKGKGERRGMRGEGMRGGE